jgi:hypothetical protein
MSAGCTSEYRLGNFSEEEEQPSLTARIERNLKPPPLLNFEYRRKKMKNTPAIYAQNGHIQGVLALQKWIVHGGVHLNEGNEWTET